MNNKIREYLSYNPDTGCFVWIKNKGIAKAGTVVQSTCSQGYLRVKFEQKNYKIHRLAWFFYYNEWPKDKIDHINGNKTDNRIINLRDVSSKDNALNRKCHRNGRLPYTFKSGKKWASKIYKESKAIYLGTFETEQEAHDASLAYINDT